MPELPEVEVLVRHLAPLLRGRRITGVTVRRRKTVLPTTTGVFRRELRGATFVRVSRRAKYLLFELRKHRHGERLLLLGHLGMTGRMYLLPRSATRPKHTSVVFRLGATDFVFEDTRYFGRLTLDTSALDRLGPEPLTDEFTVDRFAGALRCSTQPIKLRLLDQRIVSGIGNIYASEALFRAGISPRTAACRLRRTQVARLRDAIRQTLSEAIECGSTTPLDYAGTGERDGLFYFGRPTGAPDFYEERLGVYDRSGKPCTKCGSTIKRLVQGARSTYYCPRCQRG